MKIKGEKIDVEFKESKNASTKDIFDTVCSFNNRNGGHILLSVDDNREIIGANEDKVNKIIKEFTTSINNSQKMYPLLYLLPEVFKIDGKKVIYIRVPEGYQVCRYNGRIWGRSYKGDINITDHAELVYKLYAMKQGSYFANKVYPNLNIEFLDTDVIDKINRMAVARNKNHVWENMGYEELFRSTKLILTDPETKCEGITLAAILLFGKDNSIMLVLLQHKTDAIFRVENKDRYDDRNVVMINLIDSYDEFNTLYPGLKYIGITYTNTPDERHGIKYELDLEEKTWTQYIDDTPIKTESFNYENKGENEALGNMKNEIELSSFSDLVYVDSEDLRVVTGLDIDDEGNFYDPFAKYLDNDGISDRYDNDFRA